VLRLALDVGLALGLLASVAALAALEVVVLALAALPTAIREAELILVLIIGIVALHGSGDSGQEGLSHVEVGRDELAGLFGKNGRIARKVQNISLIAG